MTIKQYTAMKLLTLALAFVVAACATAPSTHRATAAKRWHIVGDRYTHDGERIVGIDTTVSVEPSTFLANADGHFFYVYEEVK